MLDSINSKRPQAPPARTGAQPAQATEDLDTHIRPPVEWWTVGNQRFDSTAELVSSYRPGSVATSDGADGDAAAVPAEYRWSPETSFDNRAVWHESIPVGVKTGLVVGALTAGLMLIGGGLSHPLATLATSLGTSLAGGAFKASQHHNDRSVEYHYGAVVHGSLIEKQGQGSPHLYFRVWDDNKQEVDMARYNQAQPGPLGAEAAKAWWLTQAHEADEAIFPPVDVRRPSDVHPPA